MADKRLQGVVIALPTPLHGNEDLDRESLRNLIDHCIEEGADGLMVFGTMGEGAALTDKVRRDTMEAAAEAIAKRVPLLVTVSAASTRRTKEYVREAETAGADFLVCTSPFYYRFPDAESMVAHVRDASEQATVPFLFYNAPGSTGNPVSVDTIDRILNLESVSGIKDSSCQFGAVSALLRRYPDPENRPGTIMQGDEAVYDASLLLGADGVVTGGGVLFVGLLKQLYLAGKKKDITEAVRLQTLFSQGLDEVLLPDPGRNWMYNIKKRLAERKIIAAPHSTAPFMQTP